MDEKRRYVASFAAGNGPQILHVPILVVARSLAEAEGLAMRACLKQYPRSEGWEKHSVVASLASREIKAEEV